MMQKSNFVLLSFVVTATVITMSKLQQGHFPTWKEIEGSFIVYLLLALTSEMNLEIANAGALLIMVSVVLADGPSVMQGLGLMVALPTAKTSTTSNLKPNT